MISVATEMANARYEPKCAALDPLSRLTASLYVNGSSSGEETVGRARAPERAPAALAGAARAQSVEGGYRLDGRWRWATGSSHGSWVMVGAAVDGGEAVTVDGELTSA